MKELIRIRDSLLGEYQHAVDTMDVQNEADGLLAAIRIVDEHIDHMIERHDWNA